MSAATAYHFGTKASSFSLLRQSACLAEQLRVMERVSRAQCSVVIVGESGTGKELVAQAIHESGPRADRPFVALDCNAIPGPLMESELFGHTRGAFTGACRNRRGILEAASGGTVFLDEIADLTLEAQVKLLRVLQEREVRPVGSTHVVKIDVQVLAATQTDLKALVDAGRFRKDLYYRLSVVTITLPPLRERKADIPMLVEHFLDKYTLPACPKPVLAEATMNLLLAYAWPGNIRELENCVQRALALGLEHIVPSRATDGTPVIPTDLPTPHDGVVIPMEELETQAILHALSSTGGHALTAARKLGIGKSTMYRRLKTLETRYNASA